MALVAYFTFDNVSSVAELDLKMVGLFPTGYTRAGTNSIVASQGRWTDTVFRATSNGTHLTLTVPAHATYIVGMWIRVNTFASSTGEIFSFRDGSTAQVLLSITTDGQIRARHGSSFATLATSVAGIIIEDTWHYVEFKALVHTSAGTVEIRVDGVTVASATGVDTQQSGTAQITNIQVNSFSDGSPSIDRQHFYILDGSGSAPFNTFLGFIRVVTDVPITDGDEITWTPSVSGNDNFEQIDEATPNNDTDYNISAVVNDDDLFLFDPILETGIPIAVQDFAVARKDDVGAREIALIMLSGISGATLDIGSNKLLAETYKYFVETRLQDPEGPTDWTDVSNVDAAQSGYRIVT
jgi:hypothetical protein